MWYAICLHQVFQFFTKDDKYLAFVANYYIKDNFDLQYSYIKMGKHFSHDA